jgi:hypothetical protein
MKSSLGIFSPLGSRLGFGAIMPHGPLRSKPRHNARCLAPSRYFRLAEWLQVSGFILRDAAGAAPQDEAFQIRKPTSW